MKRQYSGTAGKVENCQIGVFLAYGSRHGAAFLDRELYLPQEWAADGARRREAGVPQDVVFHTKAQLAQQMITRAVAAGVPFAWVTGDTVYGNDRKLRRWLEEQGRPYVLAVKSNEPLWADREGGAAQVAARELAQQIPDDRWQPLSAGDGSKGPRLYDWGWVPIGPGSEPDQGMAVDIVLYRGQHAKNDGFDKRFPGEKKREKVRKIRILFVNFGSFKQGIYQLDRHGNLLNGNLLK